MYCSTLQVHVGYYGFMCTICVGNN